MTHGRMTKNETPDAGLGDDAVPVAAGCVGGGRGSRMVHRIRRDV